MLLLSKFSPSVPSLAAVRRCRGRGCGLRSHHPRGGRSAGTKQGRHPNQTGSLYNKYVLVIKKRRKKILVIFRCVVCLMSLHCIVHTKTGLTFSETPCSNLVKSFSTTLGGTPHPLSLICTHSSCSCSSCSFSFLFCCWFLFLPLVLLLMCLDWGLAGKITDLIPM